MSRKESNQRYTDEECLTLFACLFPKGFAGEDVLAEIAPEGWMDSTLHFVFHPTLDQVHWERVQLHRTCGNGSGAARMAGKSRNHRLRTFAQLMGTVLSRPNMRFVN